MGSIYHEKKYKVLDCEDHKGNKEECHLYVFYDEGDESQYGYEIEASYFSDSSDATAFSASFGYEDWSEKLWELFGDAVCTVLDEAALIGPEAIEKAVKSIMVRDIENRYNCYQNPSDYKSPEELKETHMTEIENVLSFIYEVNPVGHSEFISKYPLEVLKLWNDNKGETK